MKTILDTAVAAGRFTAFLAALKAGAFADTLRAPGPYTVFAPTDAAFERLPPGELGSLLKNMRRLKDMLTYHVVSGTLTSRDVLPGDLKTVEGRSLYVTLDGDTILVNDAKVVEADIVASNGIIHAIDAVLMPRPPIRAAA